MTSSFFLFAKKATATTTHVRTMPKNSSQQGNVLFMILLAVLLLVALSMAIMQSNRGTGTASDGIMETYYSTISNQLSTMAAETMRLMVTGCDPERIQLIGDPNNGAMQPTWKAGECALWNTRGGRVSWVVDNGGGVAYPGGAREYGVGEINVKNIGSDTRNDIIVWANLDLDVTLNSAAKRTQFCDFYNTKHGLVTAPYPAQSGSNFFGNNGTLSNDGLPKVNFNGPSNYDGKPTGCFTISGGAGETIVYMVAIER